MTESSEAAHSEEFAFSLRSSRLKMLMGVVSEKQVPSRLVFCKGISFTHHLWRPANAMYTWATKKGLTLSVWTWLSEGVCVCVRRADKYLL